MSYTKNSNVSKLQVQFSVFRTQIITTSPEDCNPEDDFVKHPEQTVGDVTRELSMILLETWRPENL